MPSRNAESSEPTSGTCAVASVTMRSAWRPSASPRSMKPESIRNTTRGRVSVSRSQTPRADSTFRARAKMVPDVKQRRQQARLAAPVVEVAEERCGGVHQQHRRNRPVRVARAIRDRDSDAGRGRHDERGRGEVAERPNRCRDDRGGRRPVHETRAVHPPAAGSGSMRRRRSGRVAGPAATVPSDLYRDP